MPVNLVSAGGGTTTLTPASSASSYTVTLPTATGTAMVSGNMPAFSAYQSSAQSFSASTWTKVQLQTEEFDTNNNFDSVTNYRFTPTVAGYYQINGNAVQNNNAQCILSVYKNGASFKQSFYASGSTMQGASVATIIYFNGSTDYVELYFYIGGTAGTTYANNGATYFQGAMIRAA